MNIPYLLQVLQTKKLSELVANIDLPALDLNLAIWDSIDAGEIKVDDEGDNIEILVDVQPVSDDDMRNKILRVIQHYAKNETNVTRGRLNTYVKDPVTQQGYPWHEYITAAQHLIDSGQVVEEIINVPETKKKYVDKKGRQKEKVIRPAHTFVFFGLPENDNNEWNAKSVNKWIADIDAAGVK